MTICKRSSGQLTAKMWLATIKMPSDCAVKYCPLVKTEVDGSANPATSDTRFQVVMARHPAPVSVAPSLMDTNTPSDKPPSRKTLQLVCIT